MTNIFGFSVSELTAASGYARGLNFAPSGAAFDNPYSLALDAAGNVFVANDFSMSELTAASGYAKGLNFASPGRYRNLLDPPHWLWTRRATSLWRTSSRRRRTPARGRNLTAASGYARGLNFAPSGVAFNVPYSLALDAAGNVFVVNDISVSELTAASGYAKGLNFAPFAAGFYSPISLALDAAGNVFVANCGAGCGGTGSGTRAAA